MVVELHKSDFDKEQFRGYWDADRVVAAIVELAALDSLGRSDANLEVMVKQMRLYAACCAFTGKEWDGRQEQCVSDLGRKFLWLSDVTYSETDVQKLREIFVSNGGAVYAQRMETVQQQRIMASMAFAAILQKRTSVEKALRCYDGFLAAPGPLRIFAHIAQDIYDTNLIEQNKRADAMLKLLLGSQFQTPVSEQELIEKYHYPTVTDEELHDAMIHDL